MRKLLSIKKGFKASEKEYFTPCILFLLLFFTCSHTSFAATDPDVFELTVKAGCNSEKIPTQKERIATKRRFLQSFKQKKSINFEEKNSKKEFLEEIEKLTTKNKMATLSLNKSDQKIEELSAVLKKIESEKDDTESIKYELEKLLQEQESKLAEIAQILGEEKSANKELSTLLKISNVSNETSGKTIASLQATNDSFLNKEHELSEELKRLKEDQEIYEQNSDESFKRERKLLDEIQKLKSKKQLPKMKQKATNLPPTIQSIDKKLVDFESEIKQLENELEEQKRINDEQSRIIQKHKEDIESLTGTENSDPTKADSLDHQLLPIKTEELQQIIDDLEYKEKFAAQQEEKSAQIIEKIEKKLIEKTDALQVKDVELQRIKAEANQTTETVEREAEKTTQEIKTLESALEAIKITVEKTKQEFQDNEAKHNLQHEKQQQELQFQQTATEKAILDKDAELQQMKEEAEQIIQITKKSEQKIAKKQLKEKDDELLKIDKKYQEQIQLQKTTIKAAQQKRAGDQQKIDLEQAKIKKTINEKQSAKRALEEAQEEVKNYSQRLLEKEVELQKKENEHRKKLHNEKKKLSLDHDKKIDASKKEKHLLEEELKILKKKYDTLQKESAKAEILKKQIEQLEEKIGKLELEVEKHMNHQCKPEKAPIPILPMPPITIQQNQEHPAIKPLLITTTIAALISSGYLLYKKIMLTRVYKRLFKQQKLAKKSLQNEIETVTQELLDAKKTPLKGLTELTRSTNKRSQSHGDIWDILHLWYQRVKEEIKTDEYSKKIKRNFNQGSIKY